VSVIVFVNDDYEGGGLKFFGDDVAITITPTAGQLHRLSLRRAA